MLEHVANLVIVQCYYYFFYIYLFIYSFIATLLVNPTIKM